MEEGYCSRYSYYTFYLSIYRSGASERAYYASINVTKAERGKSAYLISEKREVRERETTILALEHTHTLDGRGCYLFKVYFLP